MNNYIFKLADMLGVPMYQPFKVRMLDGHTELMKFKQNGLCIFLDRQWVDCEGIMWKALFNGTIEIERSNND